MDDAQIQRLWEAFFDERDPDKLRDAVRKLFRNGQSLSNISPLRSRNKELVYERASAVLIFEFVPRRNTAKSEGLRRRAAHEILPRPLIPEWTKTAQAELA